MYPLPASTSPEEYAAQSSEMANTFGVSTFTGKFAGKDAYFFVDLNLRQMNLALGTFGTPDDPETFEASEEAKTAFAYTPDGIKFYQPVTLGGVEFDELTWDPDKVTLSYGGDALKGSLPPTWRAYDVFLGDYTLYYYSTASDYNNGKVSTLDISVTKNVYGKSYLMSGIVQGHDLVGTYDLSTGTINLLAQVVGEEPGFYYQLAANNTPNGKVSYDGTIGMTGVWEIDSDPFTAQFKDNGLWSYAVTGFIMYKFSNAGDRIGRVETGEYSFHTGSGYLRYVSKIVKK
jgi:hypothetical protein